jgi:hypothetical protein
MQLPPKFCSTRDQYPYCAHLCHWSKRLIIVNSISLTISSGDQSGLISFHFPSDSASRYRFTYNSLLSFLLALWLAPTSCFSSVLPTPLSSLHATSDLALQSSNPLGLTRLKRGNEHSIGRRHIFIRHMISNVMIIKNLMW